MKNFIPPNSPFLKADTRTKRWAIPYHSECINGRIDILLNNNRQSLQNKSILDVGSHTGIFSWSALQLGAKFVHGIDVEKRTVKRCMDLFLKEKISPSKYKFGTDNIINFLEKVDKKSFNTVFCFGVLYYITEPLRLIKLMARAAKETILIDTFTASYSAIQGKDASKIHPYLSDKILELPLMITSPTQTEKKDYHLPESFIRKGRNLSLTSLPTQAMLELWFESLDLTWEKLDWSKHTTKPCSFRDLLTPEQKLASHWADIYASGIRVSYMLHI
ncbi:MAG: methyltransferase domain-containing protein [Nitrospina sp.]|nr:methyltransferase domain-containing protein [Nitrospina sp.]